MRFLCRPELRPIANVRSPEAATHVNVVPGPSQKRCSSGLAEYKVNARTDEGGNEGDCSNFPYGLLNTLGPFLLNHQSRRWLGRSGTDAGEFGKYLLSQRRSSGHALSLPRSWYKSSHLSDV